ncbi:thioredoxin-like protein [Gautieria morchelliformis]|nr:thioredoxin-like protein [Gautieria morchelliformis]
MVVKAVTSLTEFKEIISSGKVSVFDFWATWCGPCRVISPIFEKLSAENDTLDFYKVDIDEQPDISQEVGIRSLPSFMVFKDGEKVADMIGALPKDLGNLVENAKSL